MPADFLASNIVQNLLRRGPVSRSADFNLEDILKKLTASGPAGPTSTPNILASLVSPSNVKSSVIKNALSTVTKPAVSTATAPTVATPATSLGTKIQPYVGPALMGVALADFVGNVRGSQDRRTSITDFNRHRDRANETFLKSKNAVYSNVINDTGYGDRAVGDVASNYFNSVGGIYGRGPTTEKQLRLAGFDNIEALSGLIFDGEYTFKPKKTSPRARERVPERTITYEQFIESAPPDIKEAMKNFRSSASFRLAQDDRIKFQSFVNAFGQNRDIGKPQLVLDFMDFTAPQVTARYQF